MSVNAVILCSVETREAWKLVVRMVIEHATVVVVDGVRHIIRLSDGEVGVGANTPRCSKREVEVVPLDNGRW